MRPSRSRCRAAVAGRRQRGAAGQRLRGGVQQVDAERRRGEVARLGHAGQRVRVQLQRHRPDDLLERRHQRADALGQQQAGRVLDHHAVGTQRDQLARDLLVVGVGVHRRERVDEAGADVQPLLATDLDGQREVAGVVERVVDGDPLHAVGADASDRQRDHVVGEEPEREQALAAGHDVDRRAADPLGHQPHPLPRVLVQEPHADVEDRAALEVDPVEPDPVHLVDDRQDHRVGHPRRPQRLVAVAGGDVDEPDPPYGSCRVDPQQRLPELHQRCVLRVDPARRCRSPRPPAR